MLQILKKKGVISNALKSARLHNISSAYFSAGHTFKVIDPYTNEPYAETTYKTAAQAQDTIMNAYDQHRKWRDTPLEERIKVVEKSLEYFQKNENQIAKDITCQMGKPLSQSKEEMKGFFNVMKKMINIAPESLKEKVVKNNEHGILKYTREPVGVVMIISPWNFPVLTCANILSAAVLSGNSVVIKHSPYTPLISKHFEEAFKHAGVTNLVNDLMVTANDIVKLYELPEIGYVGFTGSVETGKCVQEEVADYRFINVGLELGGNSAAYVAEDADLDTVIPELVKGALYNAGQCCNSIERVYVHSSLYDDFLNKVQIEVENYQIGNPMLDSTTLGPLTLPEKPDFLQKQVEESVGQGGRVLCGGMATADMAGKGRFYLPTIVADAQNDMDIMMTESFGPIFAVASTDSDEEAIKLINDSQYGMICSIFSKDKERILKIAPRLKVGTVYGNKVLSVDPQLPWSGRKRSGRGASLSELGFHQVTVPKSYNIKFYS